MRALIVGLLLVFIGNTTPAWADTLKGCRKGADGKLIGCEEILKLRKSMNDRVEDCRKGAPDLKISQCSRIIKLRKIYGKPISKVNLSFAYSNRGDAYYAKRQTDLAVADYSKAIKFNPRHLHAYFNRGSIYYKKRQTALAISDYSKVIKLNPKHAQAYNNRGMAYNIRGEYSLALDDLEMAVELKPLDLMALRNKDLVSENYYDLLRAETPNKNPKKPARTKQTQTKKSNTKSAENLKNQGNVYFSKKDYKRAIELFTKAIQVDPNYGPAYNNRGNSFGRLGEYDRAIADLTKALAVSPNTADVHYYNRAKIYSNKGDYTRSLADYTTALELKPNDIGTIVSRGQVYLLANKPKLAVGDFQKAVKISPKSAGYRLYLGRGLYYADRKNKAMSVWKKACQLASAKRTRSWQHLLTKAGHYSGKIDGICDFGVTIAFASCAENKCKL